MVWEFGTYEPEETDDVSAAIRKGELKFSLNGKKLKGSWVLVKTRDRQWLLIKHRDYYTTEEDVTEIAPASILTRRTLAEIAEDEGGDIKKAATGDPKKIPRRTGVKRRKQGSKKKVWHSKASKSSKLQVSSFKFKRLRNLNLKLKLLPSSNPHSTSDPPLFAPWRVGMSLSLLVFRI